MRRGASVCLTLRAVAEAIGRGLGLPTASITREEAVTHFGNPFMARVYAFDGPVSSARTRELLGWAPRRPTLIEDLTHGDYFTPPQA